MITTNIFSKQRIRLQLHTEPVLSYTQYNQRAVLTQPKKQVPAIPIARESDPESNDGAKGEKEKKAEPNVSLLSPQNDVPRRQKAR